MNSTTHRIERHHPSTIRDNAACSIARGQLHPSPRTTSSTSASKSERPGARIAAHRIRSSQRTGPGTRIGAHRARTPLLRVAQADRILHDALAHNVRHRKVATVAQ
ncbi:MAG: hypothetical protein UCO70_08370, partial [Collinsella stercoris]|nr:hypothetical protein [Collinsella stercoris]